MGSFNWDDDEGWDISHDLVKRSQEPWRLATPRNRRLGRWLGIILLGLCGAGLVLKWWVDSVEDDLAAEVLESWQIIVSSEAAGDGELFLNQLSGANKSWIKTQLTLLERRGLMARGTLISPLIVSPTTSTKLPEPEIAFSPDLTEAVFTHPVLYHDGWEREMILLQDEIFRLGADRWLFSPPKEEYWNPEGIEPETKYSKRFAYTSPEKDAELATKIILWFEDRLDAMCLNDFPHACYSTETPQAAVHFLTGETTRMLKGDFYERRNKLSPFKVVFELPSPSVVGVPLFSMDEQMLIEAYGEIFLVDYLLNLSIDGSENPCIRAIVNYSASQNDIIPPVNIDEFEQFLGYQEFIGEMDIFNSNSGHMLAFRDEIFVANGTSYQEVADLTVKLRLYYALQQSKITPQMMSSLELIEYPQDFCAKLLFTEIEHEDFLQYVRQRASLND